jgi:hypothetical protein
VKIDPPPVRAGLAVSLRRGKQFFAELKRRNVYHAELTENQLSGNLAL